MYHRRAAVYAGVFNMPSSSRLNPQHLAAFHRGMDQFIETSAVPGIVTLIACADEVDVHTAGSFTPHGEQPVQRDTIFRIASITKPIAAAATMMLVDDGRLRLDDSIEPWLPELANRRVLRSISSPLDETVPAHRSITVRDVLTYTFGFGSVMAAPGTYPIQKPVAEGHLGGDGPPHASLTPGTDEWMRRLGALPLMYQPGERWLYNTGGDLLGVLVSRVAGKTFEAFLQERLFGPLGMKDTAFSVPTEKLHRLPPLYASDHQSGGLQIFDPAAQESECAHSPAFQSGAGGLVSTADDYFAFCRMMLNRGLWRGKRLLSEAAIDGMTTDQLTPQQRQGADIFFRDDMSWTLGMGVILRQAHPWFVPGRFGWDGGFGTSAYSDPKNDFIGILLTQRMMDSPEPPPVFNAFWSLAYKTIEA